MNCIKCNASIPDGAAFCPACGKKQSVAQKKRSSSSRPNGSGSVFKRGNKWACSVTLGYIIMDDGRRKAIRPEKKGFKTKKEAMDYIPILRNTPVHKVPNLMELWEIFKTSKKFQKLSDSRKEKYEIAWKKLESLWFWKIDDLTTFDLQNAVDSNADTYYTARDLKNLLSKLYQTALPD